MCAQRLHTAIPACATYAHAETCGYFVVAPDTPLYSSSSVPGDTPMWFVSQATACAHALRGGGTPRVFHTTRPIKLVDVMRHDVVRHILRTLCADAAARSDTYVDKLRTAVQLATGYIERAQQQRLLRLAEREAAPREGFHTDTRALVTHITMGTEHFGTAEDMFDRIALATYEHAFAYAVSRVFPWADGYAAAACASTWHRDQLYPSEACVFRPASAVAPGRDIQCFAEVRRGVLDARRRIDPLPSPCVAQLRVVPYIDRDGRPEDTDDVVPEDMELRTSPLALDNPLSNNELAPSIVLCELWQHDKKDRMSVARAAGLEET